MRTRVFHFLLAAITALGLSACSVAEESQPQAAARLIQPADLVYQGALRLPEGSNDTSWEWSGNALAYFPDGDPKGPADGYPGSLFGMGHDQQVLVSEISIPAPVVSKARNVEELPVAKTLQPFRDVKAGNFKDYEIYRAGLAYLPAQGQQTSGKLYFCFGQHMHEGYTGPTHGWCETDLSNPKVAGMWPVAEIHSYVTNDFLFPIPEAWADTCAKGLRLATGRYRDGGQGGRGPSLIAIGPWRDGNPPPAGARLRALPLLLYSAVDSGDQNTMRGYHHADEWTGGAWLTAGDRAAVIFAGTKALGKCWYGFANGVVWPDEAPFPPIPPPPNDDRGWWGERFAAQILFYNPADLTAVAAGRAKPHEPQPYASLDVDPYLYHVKGPQQKGHVRDVAFDRQRGILYLMEPWADGDKPIIHVFRIK